MLDRCEAYLVLNALQNDLTWKKYQLLLNAFGSPEEILNQSETHLKSYCSPLLADKIKHWQNHFDLNNELKLIKKLNVRVYHYDSEDYPACLKKIPDPPLLLYFKGAKLFEPSQNLGIVGSRQATTYGTKTTLLLSKQMAQKGWTILSGLAWGIDTHAHRGALQGQGKTFAVIGQGLNTELYPPENKKLSEKIMAGGGIFSEFPLSFAPLPRNFPRRNRILSGLSEGVLVVEAAKRSGAFITADFALEQGKPVLAVPGPIDSKVSEGPNLLIQQGAKPVLKAEDILEEFSSPAAPSLEPIYINEELFDIPVPKGLTPHEETVWETLCNEQLQIDQLTEITGLTTNEAASTLFALEIKNLVKQLPGQYYVRL